ncbi:unnamed protein product, partial [Didymodactylos carnosus]
SNLVWTNTNQQFRLVSFAYSIAVIQNLDVASNPYGSRPMIPRSQEMRRK